jgi:hypothetical protein
LFSDRRTARGGEDAPIFLCGDCNERAVAHAGRQLNEQDMVQLAARAAGLGMAARHGAGPGRSGG